MKHYNMNSQAEKNFPFLVEKAEMHDRFPVHTHSYTEVILVLSGYGFHTSMDGRCEVRRGSVLVIPPPMAHELDSMEHLQVYVLKFDLNRFLLLTETLKNTPGFRSLFLRFAVSRSEAEPSHPLLLTESQLLHAISLIEVISEEFSASKPGSQTVIHTHLLALAAYLSRCYQPEATPVSIQMERILRTVSYMEEHLTEKIHMQQLADLVFLSARQYGRIFHAVYGRSPSSYLSELRFNKACQLMADREIPLGDIWEKCGFSDNAFFYRRFKRRFGVTPKEYRRNLLNTMRN